MIKWLDWWWCHLCECVMCIYCTIVLRNWNTFFSWIIYIVKDFSFQFLFLFRRDWNFSHTVHDRGNEETNKYIYFKNLFSVVHCWKKRSVNRNIHSILDSIDYLRRRYHFILTHIHFILKTVSSIRMLIELYLFRVNQSWVMAITQLNRISLSRHSQFVTRSLSLCMCV